MLYPRAPDLGWEFSRLNLFSFFLIKEERNIMSVVQHYLSSYPGIKQPMDLTDTKECLYSR